MRLWRISEYATLAGTGGLIAAGRWNSGGTPITYLAESSALAMLEVLVNLELDHIPEDFQLLEIAGDDGLGIVAWPDDCDHFDSAATARWGEQFLADAAAPLARIPSVIAPYSWNYLLNPLHPDAPRVTITQAARWPWDARLFAAR